MSLFTPDSFHYGEREFPWGGLLEPKLYQRFKWLLVISKMTGKIPVISMCPSNTVFVSGAECFSGCNPSEVLLSPQGHVSVSFTVPFSGVECFVGTFSLTSVSSLVSAASMASVVSGTCVSKQNSIPVSVPCIGHGAGMNMVVSNSISMR